MVTSARKSESKHREVQGFTLVALLVVIGIIGILIALILPAINGARRQAQLVQCAANLRQITSASLLHAQEHRGYLPLAGELWGTPLSSSVPAAYGDAAQRRYTYAGAP